MQYRGSGDIANLANKFDWETVENGYYYNVKKADGTFERKFHNAHKDGGTFVRSDVFNHMLKYFGQNGNGGFAKGVQIDTGFIGKLGWHIASPKMDEWLKQNDIHLLHTDATVKMGGKIKATEWTWKDGKFDIQPEVFELPWESITIQNANDGHKLNSKISFVKQLASNIEANDLGLLAQSALFNQYHKKAIEGTLEGNKLIDKYEKTGELPTDFDIDSMSMAKKIEILNRGKGDELWMKIAKDVINETTDRKEPTTEYLSQEQVSADQRWLEGYDYAKRVLKYDLSPITVMMPQVREYWKALTARYTIQKIVSPKTDGLLVEIRPHDPFAAEQIGGIKRGHYYLGSLAKKMMVEIDGRKMTLEKAFKKGYDLEHILVRVPMDSAAGARVLKFGGFLEDKSMMATMHPEDMTYAGGADTDADKVFIYPNMPKEVKDYYRTKARDWEKPAKINGKDDVYVKEVKNTEAFLNKNAEPLYPFDPRSFLQAARYSVEGNELLGTGISFTNRLRTMWDKANATGNWKIKGDGWETEFKKDRKLLEHLTSEIVNYAADASDGHALKKPKDIKQYILDQMLTKSVKLRDFVKNSDYEMMRRLDSASDIKMLLKTPKSMEEMMANPFGETERDVIQRAEMTDILSIFNEYQKSNKKLPNSFYKALEALGTVEYTPRTINSWIGNSFNLGKMLDKIQREFQLESNKQMLTDAGIKIYKAPNVNIAKAIETWKRNHQDDDKYIGVYGKKRLDADAKEFGAEIAFQDFQDARSLFQIAGAAKGLSEERKHAIREVVRTAKTRYLQTKKDLRENKKKIRTDEEVNETIPIEEIDKALGEFYLSLNTNEKRYYEALMVSTHIPKNLSKPVPQRPTKDMKEAEYEKAEQNYRDYMRTNIDRPFMGHPTVSDRTIKDMIELTKKMVNFAKDDFGINNKNVTEKLGEMVNTPIKNDIADIEDLTQDFLKRIEAKGDPALGEVANKASKKLSNFLNKYPHLIRDIEGDFMGWLNEQGLMVKGFNDATPKEVIDFIGSLEYMKRLPKDGVKLKKRDFYWLPDFQGHFQKYYDDGHATLVTKVFKNGNIIDAKVRMPMSRLTKNVSLMQQGVALKERITNKLEQRLADGLVGKTMDEITRVDLTAAKDLYFVAAANIESKGNNLHPEFFKNKEKADELFSRYEGKKFNLSIDGVSQPYTAKNIVDLYERYITQDNKYTIENIIDPEIGRRKIEENSVLINGFSWLKLDKLAASLAQDMLNQEHLGMYGHKLTELIEFQKDALKTKFHVDEPVLDANGKVVKTEKVARSAVELYPNDETQQLEFLSRMANKYDWFKKKTKRAAASFDKLGEHTFHYFPHLGMNKANRKAKYEKLLDKAIEDKDVHKIAMLQAKYVKELGADLSDGGLSEGFLKTIENREMTMEDFKAKETTAAHLRARSDDMTLGWELSPEAYSHYQKSLAESYWNNIIAFVTDYNINSFVKETKGGINRIGKENAEAWEFFMRQHVRDALGYPSLLPSDILNNKKASVKGHPYYWLTDEFWANKMRVFDKFFGVSSTDPKMIREAKVSRKLRAFSNMEAKYSLITLLTAPKTFMVNLLGATTNTISSAGYKYWKMAGDINLLKSINPEWTNMEAVEKSIDVAGGIEAFVKAEMGLSKQWNTAKGKRVGERLLNRIKKDPNLEDSTIKEILREEGMSDAFFDKASWFMRKSERMARRRAWLSHYLKAREVLEASRHTYQWDDPWLVQLANKGVQATQFLYGSVNRPAFSRTALGKVFTRFQLYMYNSIAMRKQLMSQSLEFGMDSEATEKLQRMMAADMFVMSLASILPMSIMGNAIPPPFNLLADFAKFLFGDEEDKKRAFFGVLPYPANILQPIMPPTSRLLTQPLVAMASGDWDRFASHQVWSYFPYGRVALDVNRAINNPQLASEYMFGIPYNTLQWQHRKNKKDTE